MNKMKINVEKNWRKVIIFSVLIFLMILTQDLVREIILYNNDITQLEETLNEQQKKALKEEVEFRVEEVESLHENIETELENDLKVRIDNVAFTLETVASIFNAETDLVIKEQVVLAAKNFNDSQDTFDFYIIDTSGQLYLDGESNEEVDINMLGLSDEFSRFYIEELIDSINVVDNNSSNVTAYLIEDDVSVQKMIYGHLIENTSLIVYIEMNVNEYLYYQFLVYVSDVVDYYATKESSIFILDDQKVYLQKDENLTGLKIVDITDEVTIETIRIISEFTDSNDSGFTNFEYYSNQVDGELENRIAYLEYVEEMNLTIGYSAGHNADESILQEFKSQNISSMLQTIIPMYIIIILLATYVIRLIRKSNKMAIRVFNEEEQLHKIFSDITEDIIIITSKEGEIIFANKLGKEVVFPSEEFTSINIDNIMVDEEGFKILIGIKENYYIKYTVSQVFFNSEECDLYVLQDVTEKVTTERKLEAMTLSDDLTNLGNRRLLVKDYKDYILPYIKEGSPAFLTMIDLDNFKEANDKYGHSYGDDVLVAISTIFKDHSNTDIRIYRVGGDEFAMLVINQTQNECLKLLRKIKNKVSTHNYGKKIKLGFSAGMVEINMKDEQRRLSDYYEKADKLLYQAKQEGKDKIKV